LLFSKHFNLQSVGRLAGVKREIKTETTGSFAYNFSVAGHFAERHFADGHFADGRFAERTFCRTDSLTNGQLAENKDIF
jgi:hypothetical protein